MHRSRVQHVAMYHDQTVRAPDGARVPDEARTGPDLYQLDEKIEFMSTHNNPTFLFRETL